MDASEDGLLNLLADVTDDFMLQKIAEADYQDDVELHLEALRAIRNERRVPARLEQDRHPGEVLDLIRWSEPDHPHCRPDISGRVGHVMRAFCCAVLLRAAGESANDDLHQGENQTLVQLLVSLDTLGPEFQGAALRFLVWRLEQYKGTRWTVRFFSSVYYYFVSSVGLSLIRRLLKIL